MKVLLILIVYIFFTFISTYIHELGHAISATIFGAKKVVITSKRSGFQFAFKTFFDFKRNMSNFENIFISISGVLLQLCLSFILVTQPFFTVFTLISLIYMPKVLINILPFSELDGKFVIYSTPLKYKNIVRFSLHLMFYSGSTFSLYLLLKLISELTKYEIMTYGTLCFLLWIRISINIVNYLHERRLQYGKT